MKTTYSYFLEVVLVVTKVQMTAFLNCSPLVLNVIF